jgi:hypothetical protein
MADSKSDLAFMVLLVLILGALGVSNFVEASSKGQNRLGQRFFALLYLVFALGLIVYKISHP